MLEVGSKFIQAWIGCKNPISFEVLEINREKNSLKVECTNTEGHKWIEDWEDPDKMRKSLDKRKKISEKYDKLMKDHIKKEEKAKLQQNTAKQAEVSQINFN